ncbi:MAG: tetratricopeptide repeat protein [Proteobacteria bacterium]|nr:tetratricopeptide repeat protein [Pseudomonadota bacterium]
MRQLFIISTLVLGFGVMGPISAASGSQENTSQSVTKLWFQSSEKVTRGGQMISAGKVARGTALTREAMNEGLHIYDLAVAYTNLCSGDLQLKLYKRALENCGSALSIKPGMWQALNNVANAYFGLEEYDTAIEMYQKALSARPNNPTIKQNLSITLYRRAKGEEPTSREIEG